MRKSRTEVQTSESTFPVGALGGISVRTLQPAFALWHADIDANIEPLESIDPLDIALIYTGLLFSASFLELARRADLDQGFQLPAFINMTLEGVPPFLTVQNPSPLRLAAC